jgi:hypothetical protein
MTQRKLPSVPFYKVVLNSARILKNPLPFHRENFNKFGDTFSIKLGLFKSVVFTRDAGFVQYMLQKNQRNFVKSDLQTVQVAKYLGHGLLTINGEHWRKQRRLIQPAFHKKKIESLLDTINNTITQEIQAIQLNTEQEVLPIMGDLAFQVVAKSLFSYSDKGNTLRRFQEITETNQIMLVKELRQPFKKWWFHLKGDYKKSDENILEARALLKEIIDTRIASSKDFDDLLDMLLQAKYEDGTGMSKEQLIDEILVLFTAGHETTANALSFTLLLLAKHPDIQEKVFSELSSIKDKDLSLMDKITALPYTKQCIDEAMRLYPPAYFTDRVNLEDDAYNEIKLPKGTDVLFSFYEIHRTASVWENPEQFDPERFNSDRKKVHANHYFPFGAGPRMCIGNGFAIYEMVLVISQIVEKYKLSTPLNEISVKPLITLKPEKSTLVFSRR